MATHDHSDEHALAFALRQKRRNRTGDENDSDQDSPELAFKATVTELVFTLAGFAGVIILVTVCLNSLGYD